MVLSIRSAAVLRSTVVKGQFFGARGGSCSCNPCDCNPCKCGDSAFPDPPLWRVSGCAIDEGRVGEIEFASLVVLSLALPRSAARDGGWEEILLLDSRATAEQRAVLQALFENELESLPAEIEPSSCVRRAVYATDLAYWIDAHGPHLRVNVTPASLVPLRTDEGEWPSEWSYDGPMALREELQLNR